MALPKMISGLRVIDEREYRFPLMPVSWQPGSVVVTVTLGGKPVLDAKVGLVTLLNETWKNYSVEFVKTDVNGQARLSLKPGNRTLIAYDVPVDDAAIDEDNPREVTVVSDEIVEPLFAFLPSDKPNKMKLSEKHKALYKAIHDNVTNTRIEVARNPSVYSPATDALLIELAKKIQNDIELALDSKEDSEEVD